MSSANNPVDEAFDLIALLRAIVSAERKRAIANPLDTRNLDLGILTSRNLKGRSDAEARIVDRFNTLELLLDHLNILHMAASFENKARVSIGNAVGVARASIEKGRKGGQRWPVRLVRDAKAYESLESIGDLLGLSPDDKASYDAIRKVRNEFSHGIPVKNIPAITGEDARTVLIEALERLKV